MINDNTITTIYRRTNLAQITGGAISAIAPITQIAFGNGGVDSSGNPIPPLETAATLNSELARYHIDGVTYPVPTTAGYTCTIPAADLTGTAINEVALVDSSGKVCAIKTMYTKRKDPGVAFTFTFDNEF
jgi:hypothetical protein